MLSVCVALLVIADATRIRDETAQGGLLFEGSEGCRRDNTCDIFYCHNVTIPSVPEIVELNAKLLEIHEKTLGSHQDLTDRESLIIRTSMRLAMLAYGRNDGSGLAYHALKESGKVTMLELQFKSLRHKEHKTDDTAHLVAYLFKVDGGIGVVLAYKGSTNMNDWKANFATLPRSLFPGVEGLDGVKVHRGFLAHKRRLDERLESASMQSLKPILAEWGVQTEAESFRSFLLSGDFQFLIALGHSLGGAMSAISGLELAVRTKRPVHVVGIGSAIPGNQKFTEAMDQYITPKGGLRIANDGDQIAFMGYGMLHLRRSTRVVHGYEWILPHAFRKRLKKLKMHIQYDIFEWVKRRPVRFVFPKVGETYSSNKEQLGHFEALTVELDGGAR